MRVFFGTWIVCAGIACAGVAMAAPKAGAPKAGAPKAGAPKANAKATARQLHAAATKAFDEGDYEKARDLIAQGLADAPKDLRLLLLKGSVLMRLYDHAGALEAYRAYVEAAPPGANRRNALGIIADLEKAQVTFLAVTVANGPAEVYLDSTALGLFCRAEPSCKKGLMPRRYTVIVRRPGFKLWSDPGVTVAQGQTKDLAVTLEEEPSPLVVRVAQPGAEITVDGAPYDPAAKLAAGKHQVVVKADGHGEVRREIVAREGQPIELDVALVPLVPVRVAPAEVTPALLLDGKPVALEAGGLAIPPGAHELVARAQGYQDRRIAVPAERPAGYEVSVELERVVVAPPPPPPGGDGVFTGRRKIALAAGGLGVVALGAGVVLGLQSGKLDDDAFALCPSPETPCRDALEANDLNEQARARALQANIAFGVAGGAAIAAAVLWFTGAPEARSRMSVSPRVGAVSGVDLAVRF